MKRTTFALLLILLSSLPLSAASVNTASVNRGAVRYTRRLPTIDKVELEKFKIREILIESVEATKVVEGKEAQSIAALWRSQNYRSVTPICHYPVFGIKFYSKERLILHASVCWECDNIVFMTPNLKSKQGFDGTSKKGQALLEVFKKTFSL